MSITDWQKNPLKQYTTVLIDGATSTYGGVKITLKYGQIFGTQKVQFLIYSSSADIGSSAW